MKKYKICKILLVILAIFLCVAFYELLGICVAYKKQPEVSNTTKKETKNGSWNECSENTERAVIIEKNPEALLQRVRLVRVYPLLVAGGEFGYDVDSGLTDIAHVFGSPAVMSLT